MSATNDVLTEVCEERTRQDEKWGEQNYPDGTGRELDDMYARDKRAECDRTAAEGFLTFRDILDEEVAEAFAETELPKLRAELVQVAAVAWIEAIDRRAT